LQDQLPAKPPLKAVETEHATVTQQPGCGPNVIRDHVVMPGLDRIEAAVQPGVHALCSHSCQHGCMVSPKPPTQPAKTPRRRATLLQAQARRMSKLLSIEFGLALRDARLRASLSQRDLAKRARVRRTYISRVELGEQNLTLATMMRLARAVSLGVSLAITDDDPTLPATLLSVSPSGPRPPRALGTV